MNDPLFNIRKVTQIDFFSKPENTVEELVEYFSYTHNNVGFAKLDTGEYLITSMDSDISYKLEEPEEACVLLFEKWEQDLRYNISEKIYEDLDQAKSEVYINRIVNDLTYILKQISTFNLSNEGSICRDHIFEKINALLNYLTHLKNPVTTSTISVKAKPKIKWLGQKNQLPTLIFDLWKGQKRTSKNETEFPPHIDPDTSKEVLMSLILDNFVDKEGKPFSESSVNDQLNTSEEKNVRRASRKRIELSLK